MSKLSRFKKWLSWWLSEDWEKAWLSAADNETIGYLIRRTQQRDSLFHMIEEAIRDRRYTQAISYAEQGWQLKGR